MLMQYPRCHRGRKDCSPVSCVAASPSPEVAQSMTEDDWMTCNYTPTSFVCSGFVDRDSRGVKQDCYRLCFKNHCSDEMSDNDMQDLTSIVKVIGDALCLDAVRKVNSGVVELPAEQSKEGN